MARGNTPKIAVSNERRRNSRFVLGLPVRVHLAGTKAPITVEVVDLSASGGRFRSPGQTARLDQGAALAFVLPGQRHCVAKGRVVRTEASGEFALHLEKVNDAFLGFVGEFTGEELLGE